MVREEENIQDGDTIRIYIGKRKEKIDMMRIMDGIRRKENGHKGIENGIVKNDNIHMKRWVMLEENVR